MADLSIQITTNAIRPITLGRMIAADIQMADVLDEKCQALPVDWTRADPDCPVMAEHDRLIKLERHLCQRALSARDLMSRLPVESQEDVVALIANAIGQVCEVSDLCGLSLVSKPDELGEIDGILNRLKSSLVSLMRYQLKEAGPAGFSGLERMLTWYSDIKPTDLIDTI